MLALVEPHRPPRRQTHIVLFHVPKAASGGPLYRQLQSEQRHVYDTPDTCLVPPDTHKAQKRTRVTSEPQSVMSLDRTDCGAACPGDSSNNELIDH